jgi:hypothetical protein
VALFSAVAPGTNEAQKGEHMADATSMLTEIRDMVATLVKHEAEMEPEVEPEDDEMKAEKKEACADDNMTAPPDESFMADEAEGFKQYNTEQRREMAGKGWALPDGSFPIADTQDLQNAVQAIGRGANNPKAQIKAHIVKRARSLGATDMLPPDWAGSTKETANSNEKEVEVMADEKVEKVEELAVKDELNVKAEDFKALVEKAKQLDDVMEQMKAAAQQAEEFKAKLAQAEYDRDLDRMTKHADEFMALPINAQELGKKLLDLKLRDADLFAYFDGLLKTADQLLMQTDLFGQRGTQRTRPEETFEAVIDQVLAEKFDGDKSRYSEAMAVARTRRPDLMSTYLNQPRGSGR